MDENALANPVNFYGKSKAAAEQLLIDSNISWSILRTVLVYGITTNLERSNIVLWVKDNLEKRKTIRVVNDQWRTPTLAEDLALGCHLTALKKAKGIFNISGKDFMSAYELAVRTAKFFKLDNSLIVPVDSTQFKQTAQRPLRTGFLIEKARTQLGYEPHSFEAGLSILESMIDTLPSLPISEEQVHKSSVDIIFNIRGLFNTVIAESHPHQPKIISLRKSSDTKFSPPPAQSSLQAFLSLLILSQRSAKSG